AAALLTMSAMLAFSFGSDAIATLGLLGAIVGVSALLIPLRRVVRRYSSEAVDTQVGLSSAVAELAELRAEVEAFGVGLSAFSRVGDRIQSDGQVGRRMAIIKQLIPPAYHGITYLAVALGLLLLTRSSPDDLTTVGPIMLVILRTLAYGQAVQQGAVLIAQIGPFLGYLNSTVARFRDRAVREYGDPVRQFEEIRFLGVSFHYPISAGGRGVESLDLTIRRGESVGLVGPSGGGKSTTLKLLAALYEPTDGLIEIDGRSLTALSRKDWTSLVGFVPQHPRLLFGSISENVRFFRDGISDDEIRTALSAADLLAEVEALEHGIETVVGPGATALSGGQMQRLAIARALVGGPQLIVMDEPTSAIDQESEREVAAAVAAVAAEVTVVIASHRPRILEHCDRIIEVSASGSAAERFQTKPTTENE
ncbi:MAG: ABC transporter ATP-binding protein, partial [Actinomycetota bacterium]|nr:ABC transporter ATP-binding protein [Actinomycetota bacterium]